MSFELDGSEAQIAANLGSLEGYLANQQYTTAQVAMQGEQVVRHPGNLGSGSAPDAYDYAPEPGVSREQFEQMVEYAQRMEQTAQVAAQQAIQQEEARFLAQLDYAVEMGQITEAQRDVQIVLRRNEQLEQSHMTMAQRIAYQEDAQEEAEQMDAKVRVSYREAMDHGVNWFNNDVRRAILEADTLEDMQSKLRVLQMYPGARLTPQQAANAPTYPTSGQVANGAFAAAGGRGSGGPPQQVKKGSSDLAGYIRAKGGYQTVLVE